MQVATAGPFSIESRQALYTKLIIATALRRLISGDKEDEIVGDLVKYKRPLVDAGGPSDLETYGPKVKRVFEAIVKRG